jgi:hypothetical protein
MNRRIEYLILMRWKYNTASEQLCQLGYAVHSQEVLMDVVRLVLNGPSPRGVEEEAASQF